MQFISVVLSLFVTGALLVQDSEWQPERERERESRDWSHVRDRDLHEISSLTSRRDTSL